MSSELRYALFLGCAVPKFAPNLELSLRKVLENFGVELETLDGAGCCGFPIDLSTSDHKTVYAISAMNLALAEEKDLDLLTICNGCYETLKKAEITLKTRPKLRDEINKVLEKIGREYKGRTGVKHVLEVLWRDIGVEKIRSQVTNPLKGLKIATHYGCHLISHADDVNKLPSASRITGYLDEIVSALGGEVVEYSGKKLCCGNPLIIMNLRGSLEIAFKKLKSVSEAKADCLVTACSTCYYQFDQGQLLLRRIMKGKEKMSPIPILYITELIGLSQGFSEKDLGLTLHRISLKSVLGKISSGSGGTYA